jgi:predicted Co/Zn/Cd cation transporter (cation efflux family)
MNPASEQGALKLSILVTALIGVGGIAAGFMIGSRAIMFDGMYSFVDVLTTSVALTVSKLLLQEANQTFSVRLLASGTYGCNI